jgi:AraC family transcriptional regulator
MNRLDDVSFVLQARSAEHYWKGAGLLSIKSFEGGGAFYRTAEGRFLVDAERFLIVNHDQEYEVEIDADAPVASFCVFFASDLAQQVQRSLTAAPEALLDDPLAAGVGWAAGAPFFERTYPHDDVLSPLLTRFRQQYPQRQHEPGWVEEQYHLLMHGMLSVQQAAYQEVDTLPSVRSATREELYRRLYIARDYIAAAYDQPITLQSIADAAVLSPNHLLRSFKALFGQTPYQVLVDERLRHARLLLASTERPVTQICLDVGYESLGSFSALFAQRFGLSPQAFRLLNYSQSPISRPRSRRG